MHASLRNLDLSHGNRTSGGQRRSGGGLGGRHALAAPRTARVADPVPRVLPQLGVQHAVVELTWRKRRRRRERGRVVMAEG